jgi:hypothetical protein
VTDERFSEALDEVADRVHIDRYGDELDQIVKRIEKVETAAGPATHLVPLYERLELQVSELGDLAGSTDLRVSRLEERERQPLNVRATAGDLSFEKDTKVMRAWLDQKAVNPRELNAQLKQWVGHFDRLGYLFD